jgi:2',3'-cyclic-nucleotide 2'-phosphodiesterase (5'-nucleotidase family)
VQSIRCAQKEMLLLDSGDLLFKRYRKPIADEEVEALTAQAALIIECFNLMGCDALGVGDDDLSLGKDVLFRLSHQATFAFISSNLMNASTGKTLFTPSLITERGGLKIGIFSLIAPAFFDGSSDPRLNGLSLEPPFETAERMLRQLREKTDVIVLLSHLGLAKDVELAQSISGIDVIIGGHSGVHIGTPQRVNQTIILHTAANGMSGARIDLQPTRENISHALARMPTQLEFTTYLTPLTEDIGSRTEIDKHLDIYLKKYPHRIAVDGP